MTSLFNKKGEEIREPKEIRNIVYDFYKTLYESKEDAILDVDLEKTLDLNTPKLSEFDRLSMGGEIKYSEASNILLKMQHNKSPGSSGFSSEFLKFFWGDLGHIVLKSINYGFEKGELSSTQKEGVITCIPKGDKCKKYIKNWRPISLLNITYKIASGCIANRIKKVLPSIIDYDQSGFMSGRFTGDNIRLIYDILNHSNKYNNKGILLLIDFEKAFDSVSWSFMEKCLIYFNFHIDVIHWIKVFYQNIKSTVIVNNKPTPWFFVERGCRQGDPISPYIFLLCSEVLAHMIRQNKEIKGYTIFDQEIKISQYADDTSLFLDGSQKSFETCVDVILEYAKYSGLAMNFEKTKAVWFGCHNNIKPVYMPNLGFSWNPEKFNLLGIDFTINLVNITDNNIEKKLGEIQRDINTWSKRDITPFGRVTIIKALLVSKIVHILISLPSPSVKMIKKINTLLFDFLWDGKPDKIKRKDAILKFEKGGLGMISIESFDKALKLTWLRRMLTSESKWKKIIFCMYPKLNEITLYGDCFIKSLCKVIDNLFWENVLTYLYEFHSKIVVLTFQEFKATCFQFNSNFKIGNSVINNPLLARSNIFFVYQLMEGNEFLTHEAFKEKYDIEINYLTFHSIITCLKNKVNINDLDEGNRELNYQPAINAILSKKKRSNTYLQFLFTI